MSKETEIERKRVERMVQVGDKGGGRVGGRQGG